MGRLSAASYFVIQRAREGLRRSDTLPVSRLLDSPAGALREHTSQRISAVHGISAGEALRWLGSQPATERSVIQARGAAYRPPHRRPSVEWRSTSGSSGARVVLPRDSRLLRQMDATMWAVYAWHGIGPADHQARFWGRSLHGPRRLAQLGLDRAFGRTRLDSFSITPERSVDFFRRLVRTRAGYAYGYPSVLQVFADHCSAAGCDGAELRLKAVIVTGEHLPPAGRERLASFFQTRVLNEYGCTESGILGFECESGTQHPVPFAAFPEVATIADDLSVSVGTDGEVLVTDLFGEALPLVRYRLGDRARMILEAPCDCGRELGMLQVGIGRSGAFVQLPSGRQVYSGVVSACAPRGIQRFQARQTASDTLSVLVVPGVGFRGTETLDDFRSGLQEALGGELRVFVEVTDSVPPDPSGKLRHFIPLQP